MNKLFRYSIYNIVITAIFCIAIASCGGGGTAENTGPIANASPADDQDISIEGASSRITIPAGALPSDMTISLFEDGVDISDIETSRTLTAISIESSSNFISNSPLTLELRVPDPSSIELGDGEVLVAMVRIEGERIGPQEFSSEAWSPAMGSWDPESGTYTLELDATAPKISIALVVMPAPALHLGDDSEGSDDSLAQRVEIPAKAQGFVGWGSRKWAIICMLSQASDLRNFCNFQTADPERAFWKPLADGLPRASRILSQDMMFRTAVFRPYSVVEINAAFGSHGILADGGLGDPNGYNVTLIVDDNACSHVDPEASCYDVHFKRMMIHKSLLENSADQIMVTLGHEMMHGVQMAEIPGMWNLANAGWILEGTADVVGLKIGQRDVARSNYSSWRNWTKPLRTEELPLAYETSEFWGMIKDGDISYMKQLYENMSSANPQDSSYAIADAAIRNVLSAGLEDLYLKKVLPKRFARSGYPHCAAHRGPVENAALSPMSSECYRLQVTDSAEPGVRRIRILGDDSLRLVIEGGGNNNPLIYSPNDWYYTNLNIVDVQAVSVDAQSPDNAMHIYFIEVEEIGDPLTGTWCSDNTSLCLGPDGGERGAFVNPATCLSDVDYTGEILQIRSNGDDEYYGRFQLGIEIWGTVAGEFAGDQLSLDPVFIQSGEGVWFMIFTAQGTELSGLARTQNCDLATTLTKVSANPFATIPGLSGRGFLGGLFDGSF